MTASAVNKLDAALSDISDMIARRTVGSALTEIQIQMILRGMFDLSKTPSWLKSSDGRMIYLNPAYTKEFGKTMADYGGERDFHEWGEPIAAAFCINDSQVIRTREETIFHELAPVDGIEIMHEVRKRPFIIAGEIIGVIGERLRRLDVKG